MLTVGFPAATRLLIQRRIDRRGSLGTRAGSPITGIPLRGVPRSSIGRFRSVLREGLRGQPTSEDVPEALDVHSHRQGRALLVLQPTSIHLSPLPKM